MTFEDRFRLVSQRLGGSEDPEDPTRVLAMPIVLRIEKADPPSRRALLEAAARASVLLCLDERADPYLDAAATDDFGEPDEPGDPDEPEVAPEPGPGPWHSPVAAWCGARIRKISRRARGAQWIAAQEVDGLTVTVGGASARAIVPGPVGDLDRRIARLQIGGTDLDAESMPVGTSGTEDLVLWVNPRLDMTVGKLSAQVGHAAMIATRLYTATECERWWLEGCPLTVAVAAQPDWPRLVDADGAGTAAVRDAGFTEVEPGSLTVIAERTGVHTTAT